MKSNKQTNPKPTLTCSMCGLCCKIFLINLNEEEYLSGNYHSVFDDIIRFDNFKEAEEVGAIFLKQNVDGSCAYLIDNKCNIHSQRPEACREFFCLGEEKRFKYMRYEIANIKNG